MSKGLGGDVVMRLSNNSPCYMQNQVVTWILLTPGTMDVRRIMIPKTAKSECQTSQFRYGGSNPELQIPASTTYER